ncbi:MAG TPA: hypothetical protein VK968_05785, partial [Roseimicrobium sp.]|nr:hypothetical protein [Roseimicrobium sp.]
ASLTRVETQVAANNQQLAQARQNALMAMNIALGRLQAAAGPDTRATGTADLVSGRDINKKYWTGVWNASVAGADKNIAWLVSGAAPAGSGGVTTPLTAAPGNTLVDLVGANSTDISVPILPIPPTGNRVQVETQPITSAVPGLAGTPIVGNFAYWVGDEGVKAKVSLTDPWESPTADTKTATGVSDATAAIYRFVGAQRSGIEGISTATPSADITTQLSAAAYPATDSTFKASLPKTLSLHQLPLANSGSQAVLSAAIKSRFHDLTTSSYSVLSDPVSGGLKKDLTSWLRSPASATNPPLDTDLIASPAITGDPSVYPPAFLPKWGMIRSYAGIAAGTAIAPQFQTDTQQGVHPVVTYARMGYNASRPDPASPVLFHLFPVVVLWNPYSVPIAATTYKFKFDYINNYATIKIVSGIETSGTKSSAVPLTYLSLYDQRTYAGTAQPSFSTAGNNPITFPLASPQILPGQSLVFTLDNTAPYLINTNTLSPNNPSRQDNSATIAGAVIPDALLPADKTTWFMNTFGNLGLTLTDTSNQPFHLIQNTGTFVGYGGAPVNTKSVLPTDAFTVKLYVRVENYISEGAHGGSGLMPRWLAQLNPTASLVVRKPRDPAQGGQNSLSYYMDTQGLLTWPFLPTDRASMGAGSDV